MKYEMGGWVREGGSREITNNKYLAFKNWQENINLLICHGSLLQVTYFYDASFCNPCSSGIHYVARAGL